MTGSIGGMTEIIPEITHPGVIESMTEANENTVATMTISTTDTVHPKASGTTIPWA